MSAAVGVCHLWDVSLNLRPSFKNATGGPWDGLEFMKQNDWAQRIVQISAALDKFVI